MKLFILILVAMLFGGCTSTTGSGVSITKDENKLNFLGGELNVGTTTNIYNINSQNASDILKQIKQ